MSSLNNDNIILPFQMYGSDIQNILAISDVSDLQNNFVAIWTT